MKRLPVIGFVGPMLGKHFGHVTTQGEILAEQFINEGYTVISVSSSLNRYLRLADIIKTLIIQRHNLDLLCLQVYSGPSFLITDIASRLGNYFGLPIVMVLRGGSLPEFCVRFPKWVYHVLNRADTLIAPSEFLANSLAPHGFQVHVIPNVINLSNYPYRHRSKISPRLIWMRTFHPIYNPMMAIRVLAQLRETIPDASLVMGGEDKGLQVKVQRQAKILGVDDAVHFVGFMNMSTKAHEGSAADIFLNTNHVDNMPVSVVEACAMGLPIVATAVGGLPYLLDNEETGLLVPDNDDQAMVNAILRLISDPNLTEKLSSNGRKLAERSSWKELFPHWRCVFSEAIASRQKCQV